MTIKFNGTIEYLLDQKAAIVELDAPEGEWGGIGKVIINPIAVMTPERLKQALYEEGYRMLSLAAKTKGGRLETYKEYQKDETVGSNSQG